MAPEQESSVGRELVARLNEKIQHVNEMIEQKLEYQGKLIDSRLDGIEKSSAEKMLGFSVRLEEAVQEVRSYKEILQQQVTLLDSSIKKSHFRMDEIDSHGTTYDRAEFTAVRKELQDGLHELEIIMDNVHKLETAQHDKSVEAQTRENDPFRKFLAENGRRVLMFVLLAIGLLILKNLPDLLSIVTKLSEKAGGG